MIKQGKATIGLARRLTWGTRMKTPMKLRMLVVVATAALSAVVSLGVASPASAGEGNPGTGGYRDSYLGVGLYYSYATQWLNSGNSWTFGTGQMGLRLHSDGQLVITNQNGLVVWATAAAGPNSQMRFEKNGELKLIKSNGVVFWTSGVPGACINPNVYHVLALQDDNNVVVYCFNNTGFPPGQRWTAKWASGT
jgi:hypothetical protein